jgi:hypothetical protein
MLAFGSCFQSISSDGQSRLMKLPSGQKAKMLAGDIVFGYRSRTGSRRPARARTAISLQYNLSGSGYGTACIAG